MSPLSFYYIVYVICFQFFLSHWEKYNTGVLYLPWAYDASQVGGPSHGHIGIDKIHPFSFRLYFFCIWPCRAQLFINLPISTVGACCCLHVDVFLRSRNLAAQNSRNRCLYWTCFRCHVLYDSICVRITN